MHKALTQQQEREFTSILAEDRSKPPTERLELILEIAKALLT